MTHVTRASLPCEYSAIASTSSSSPLIIGTLRQNEVQRWWVQSDIVIYACILRLRAKEAKLLEKWAGWTYISLDVVWTKMLTIYLLFQTFHLLGASRARHTLRHHRQYAERSCHLLLQKTSAQNTTSVIQNS